MDNAQLQFNYRQMPSSRGSRIALVPYCTTDADDGREPCDSWQYRFPKQGTHFTVSAGSGFKINIHPVELCYNQRSSSSLKRKSFEKPACGGSICGARTSTVSSSPNSWPSLEVQGTLSCGSDPSSLGAGEPCLLLGFPASFLIFRSFSLLVAEAVLPDCLRLREAMAGLGICASSASRTERRCAPRVAIALVRNVWSRATHSLTRPLCTSLTGSPLSRCMMSRHRTMPAAIQKACWC
jgi:hypothetical protein